MSKIGVAVGEEFPLQDLPSDSAGEREASADNASQASAGESRKSGCEKDARAEFARSNWHHEGQRCWDADVRNQHAEWEAKKRAFKEKIRAAVHDALHASENRRHHTNGNSHRLSAWPRAFVGLGIAALAFAIHRHKHAPHRPPPPDGGEPIVTPPPPREV